MNRLLIPLGLSFLSLFQTSYAQENNPLIVSGDLLKEAGTYYDSSQYKKAIALYSRIDRNDTNYVRALYGISQCYYEDSQFDASIAYIKTALAADPDPGMEPELLNHYGNILNESGSREQAIRIYDSAIRKYPAYSLFYLNKGSALIGLHRFADAEAVFKQGLLIDPYSSTGHYKLGYCALQQGKTIPAFISFMGYLVINPNGSFRASSISWMSKIAENLDTIQTLVSRRTDQPDENYQLLEQIVQSKIALDKSYSPLLKLDDPISRQMQVILEKMEFQPEASDFWMQYYVPWLKSVFAANRFECLVNRLFLGVELPVIQDYVKKHKKELKQLTDDLVDYLDKIIVTRDLRYTRRQQDSLLWTRNEGSLTGYGNYQPKEDIRRGQWLYLYGQGNIKGKGVFDATGRRQGDFTWYYYNGKTSGKEFYQDGKQQGEETYYFSNGQPSSHSWYKDDSLEGVSTRFFWVGIPRTITRYHNGKEDGEKIIFRSNGDTSEIAHYSGGKLNGEDHSWNNYGTTESVANFTNGIVDGTFRKFYPNGKLAEQGEYKMGKQEGEWKWWWPNGQLKLITSFTNDQNNGERKEFFENGVTKSSYLVKMDKIVGDAKYFDDDGKPTSLQHFDDNGRLQKAVYWDKAGKILGESTRDKDKKTIDLTEFQPDGAKKSNALYDDKQNIVGILTTWFSSGKTFSAESYSNGQLDGPSKTWYPNGNKRSEMSYKAGKLDGYRRSWFKHGQLQEEGWYKDGQTQGYWLDYNELGALTDSICFRDDEPVGYKTSYEPNGHKSIELKFRTGWLTDFIQYDSTGRELSHFSSQTGTGHLRLVYPNGNRQVEGEYKGSKLVGPYNGWFFDGKPLEARHYTRGLQDSSYTAWYYSGRIRTRGQYAFGEKTGLWQYYYDNGKLNQTETYDHGQLKGTQTDFFDDGKTATITCFRDDDKEGPTQEWDHEGNLLYVVNYHQGDPVSYSYWDSRDSLVPAIPIPLHSGKVKSLFPNGKVSAEFEFADGQFNGEKRLYYPSGQLRSTLHWDNGMAEGQLTQYHPNGKIKIAAMYLHNNLHGPYKKYDEKGILREEWNYYNDVPNGTTRLFDENGHLTETDYYYYGTLLSVKK